MKYKQSSNYLGAGYGFGRFGVIWIYQPSFGSDDDLQDTIGHEARHLQLPLTQLYWWHPDKPGDPVYDAGHACSVSTP